LSALAAVEQFAVVLPQPQEKIRKPISFIFPQNTVFLNKISLYQLTWCFQQHQRTFKFKLLQSLTKPFK
jgi:hypothetical protein